MRKFLIISRSPFFTAIAAPVIFATIVAWRDTGLFSGWLFLATLIGAVTAHAGANIFNDYYDFKLGADRNNPYRNKFSGGSPHMVMGWEKPSVFLTYGLLSFAVALVCGVLVAWKVDHRWGPIAWLALSGFACGFFYTASPFKLVYRGWGEVLIFIAFGILPVVGAYYVQTKELSPKAFLLGLPFALLVTNILWINEFPDYESDKAAGKRHMVVRLGLPVARFGFHAMLTAAFVLLLVFSFTPILGRWGLIGTLGLLPALAAAVILHRHYDNPPALEKAQGLTILANLATGLLLCVGVWLGR
jgi:1,4-dihydroxy-2-naphthoate polyprenyltransferase